MITQEMKFHEEPVTVVTPVTYVTPTNTGAYHTFAEVDAAKAEAVEAGLVPGVVFKYKTGTRLYRITAHATNVRKFSNVKKPSIIQAMYVYDEKLDREHSNNFGPIHFSVDDFIDGNMEIVNANPTSCC